MNYSKIKKKLVPVPDGSPGLHLQTATVSAIASDGTVDIMLNGATVPDVPVLGSARFVSGQSIQVLTYRGSLLVIGSSGRMISQIVATSGSITNGTNNSGSNATFFNSLTTTGTHGQVFVAPPSGKVLVTGRAVASNGTAGGFALLDFEIRAGSSIGSGTVFRASNSATAGANQSSTASNQGMVVTGDLIVGLTPGAIYNATLTYASGTNGQTLTYNRRHISVVPA